jgi:hypothetical protein
LRAAERLTKLAIMPTGADGFAGRLDVNGKPVVAMALGRLGGFNAHDAGVRAAAYASYWNRWLAPPPGAPLRDLFDRLLPAQVYQPTRPESFFTQLAAGLSGASVPIMCNAYALDSGRELVFCNQAAFAQIFRRDLAARTLLFRRAGG